MSKTDLGQGVCIVKLITAVINDVKNWVRKISSKIRNFSYENVMYVM